MSQVVSGVLEKLQDLLPDQIGDNARWTTSDVERHIMLADRAFRERSESLYNDAVPQVRDTYYEYTLDTDMIDVISVEFSADGSVYDDYLKPITLEDLDKINPKWRSDGSSKPEYYVLLGTPGFSGCRIILYPIMSDISDSPTMRIVGHSIGATTDYVPDDIQETCHVPYVMSILKANESPREAVDWHRQFLDGCEEAKKRYRNKFRQNPGTARMGW
jgi:hypothetical protein